MRSRPVLLLDLGGVLADLGRPAKAIGLGMSEADFWDHWVYSREVRRFETGALQQAEFMTAFGESLPADEQEHFLSGFENWRLRLFDATLGVLQRLSRRYRLSLLSNTNPLHWAQVNEAQDLTVIFDTCFLSFRTGQFKPDASAFHQVLNHYACAPQDLIFVDDTPANVGMARALGIPAFLVNGEAGLRQRAESLLGS